MEAINAVSKELRLERVNSWRHGYVSCCIGCQIATLLHIEVVSWYALVTKSSLVTVLDLPHKTSTTQSLAHHYHPKTCTSHIVSPLPPGSFDHLDVVSTQSFSTRGRLSPCPSRYNAALQEERRFAT